MDKQTLQAYDTDAAGFAKEWHEQAAPVDMYDLLRRYFKPGPTVDIGCGSGRDVAWLVANGYDANGFDASESLLQHARATHPEIRFSFAALPDLAGVERGVYENVLCETVIMHLEPAALLPSLRRLTAILAPGGTLYLSWRVTRGGDRRDEHGRLYAVVDGDLVNKALSDLRVLVDEEHDSASSGKVIRRIVARKR